MSERQLGKAELRNMRLRLAQDFVLVATMERWVLPGSMVISAEYLSAARTFWLAAAVAVEGYARAGIGPKLISFDHVRIAEPGFMVAEAQALLAWLESVPE